MSCAAILSETAWPERIGAMISAALREELATYPKPGLVSYVDHGSHPDMTSAHFEASITALQPHFVALAQAGARDAGLAELQFLGQAAEREMLAATGQRNCHRGAIFCLGLLAAAAGWQARDPESERTLGEIVQKKWAAQLPDARELPPRSAGIIVCQQHQMKGVRGEAAAGFPSVMQHGLPVWKKALADGQEDAGRVLVFFHLLRVCEDTTLWKRGGPEGAAWAREQAEHFLQRSDVSSPTWWEAAIGIHREFVCRNLTAGGVADLLAATLFIHAWEIKTATHTDNVL